MISRGLVITPRHFLVFIFVSYAVVISFFIDSGLRNYLVLVAAITGGVLFFQLPLVPQRQAFMAFLVLSIMTVNTILQDGAEELGSIALTSIYATGYFALASLLDQIKDKRGFLIKVMNRLVYAFAILSVVQLLTSLMGFPVPNLIASKGLWSYNSLSNEPSQLGRVVGIIMLSCVILSRLQGGQEQSKVCRKLVIAFLTTMLLSASSLAAIAILAVYLLSRSLPWFVLIVMVSLLMWPLFFIIDFEVIERFVGLISNLISLDLGRALEEEHSGAIRIAPLLIYLRDMSITEMGFWLGYGSEGLLVFFQDKIPGVSSGVIFGGFLPVFAVKYGILTFSFFIWIFVLWHLNRATLPLIAFWLIFITNSAFNTQVFWFGLIVIQMVWSASREVFTEPESKGL